GSTGTGGSDGGCWAPAGHTNTSKTTIARVGTAILRASARTRDSFKGRLGESNGPRGASRLTRHSFTQFRPSLAAMLWLTSALLLGYQTLKLADPHACFLDFVLVAIRISASHELVVCPQRLLAVSKLVE